MKIRSEVYTAVRDALKKSIPLEYIDLQKGQMQRRSNSYPVPLPCCLVELRPVQWSNIGGGQIGKTSVRVHYYESLATDSFNGAESECESISMLDTYDELSDALQGLAGEHFQPLNRILDAPPDYSSSEMHFVVDFETAIIVETDTAQTSLKPKPQINMTYV